MGWHLAGLARAWAWAALYAWVTSRLTSQAQMVEAPRDLGCYCEASYSVCQVSMCPRLLRILGAPRPPDEARWGHADPNYGHARPLVTYMEPVGSVPMGQDQPRLCTDVGLALLKVPEEVALPRDDKSRWHAPPGSSSLERMRNPTVHDGPDENEDDPSFSEDGELNWWCDRGPATRGAE